MKAYEVLTGELVLIYAENDEEMEQKLADGDWEELECLSEVQSVTEVEDEDN
jgi:hypothetical protein